MNLIRSGVHPKSSTYHFSKKGRNNTPRSSTFLYKNRFFPFQNLINKRRTHDDTDCNEISKISLIYILNTIYQYNFDEFTIIYIKITLRINFISLQ